MEAIKNQEEIEKKMDELIQITTKLNKKSKTAPFVK